MTLPDSIAERARQGAKVRRDVLGAAYVDAGKQQANPFTQHFIEFTQTQCWGNVWLREGLSHQTRSMLNVCMLAALARWHEFEVHVRGALNNGVTAEQIAEILLHTAVYAGIPDRFGRVSPRRQGDCRCRSGEEALGRTHLVEVTGSVIGINGQGLTRQPDRAAACRGRGRGSPSA